MDKRTLGFGILCLLLAGIVIVVSALSFMAMHKLEPIYAGPGVTEITTLSEYFSGLKGTHGDTAVYILEGKEPGATMLVLGGTHPNEPSGVLSAILLIENAEIKSGRLIVIPRANSSALTHNDPQEASPQRMHFQTAGGERWVRYGSRRTNPVHAWPDQDVYVHYPSGQILSGSENKNLNRAYPGKPDGGITQKIAYGITQLIKSEQVAMTVDLHESSPEYPVNNAIVVHERAVPLGINSILELELLGIHMKLENSPKNLRGLTHRELGDHTDTLALLIETPNPAQGRLRDQTTEQLVLTGKSNTYLAVAGMGKLYIPYDESGYPLERRVKQVLACLEVFASEYTKMFDDSIVFEKYPDWKDMEERGLGAYLSDPL